MPAPIPIGQEQTRLPQAGRIRIGEKMGKGMRAIDTFRFTSPEQRLLAPIAELYGGEIKPWHEPKSGDRFELRTTATEINIQLPDDPLTRWYELWSGKGLLRRCDGNICTRRVPGPEGWEMADEDCICLLDYESLGKPMQCENKMRLSVLIPEVETLGTWRLDTGSEYAWGEMPKVVETIVKIQGRGFTRARLRIEQRVSGGKRFNVPVLDPGVSLDSLLAGEQRVVALPGSPSASPPTSLALAEGGDEATGGIPHPPVAPSPDDEIVDAEFVEEVDPTIARAWIDNMTTPQKNQALLMARDIATALDEPVPTNVAAIPTHILNQLAKELLP